MQTYIVVRFKTLLVDDLPDTARLSAGNLMS